MHHWGTNVLWISIFVCDAHIWVGWVCDNDDDETWHSNSSGKEYSPQVHYQSHAPGTKPIKGLFSLVQRWYSPEALNLLPGLYIEYKTNYWLCLWALLLCPLGPQLPVHGKQACEHSGKNNYSFAFKVGQLCPQSLLLLSLQPQRRWCFTWIPSIPSLTQGPSLCTVIQLEYLLDGL